MLGPPTRLAPAIIGARTTPRNGGTQPMPTDIRVETANRSIDSETLAMAVSEAVLYCTERNFPGDTFRVTAPMTMGATKGHIKCEETLDPEYAVDLIERGMTRAGFEDVTVDAECVMPQEMCA